MLKLVFLNIVPIRNKLPRITLTTDSMVNPASVINTFAMLGPEVYSVKPFAININLSSSDRSKLYLKVTDCLPHTNRISFSLTTKTVVYRHLEIY